MFAVHLKEAIEINRERKKIYSKMTETRSLALSRALIFFESCAMPAAIWIDRQAIQFNKMGIRVIEGDLVPMVPLPPADAPPLYRKRASKNILSRVKTELKKYRHSIRKDLERCDFLAIAERSFNFYQEVKKIEEEQNCHFAMTRHLVESLGFSALHAPLYAESSAQATIPLSKRFIWMQIFGLGIGLWLDKKAQDLHAMGAGILVNDVPRIPFEEEFEKSTEFHKSRP